MAAVLSSSIINRCRLYHAAARVVDDGLFVSSQNCCVCSLLCASKCSTFDFFFFFFFFYPPAEGEK